MGNLRCGTTTRQALLCPMFIQGVGTAAPDQVYTQAQCWEAVRSASAYEQLSDRARALLRRVLNADNGIRTRHLALDQLEEAFEMTPDALHRRFLLNAPRLASLAARRAVADARVSIESIDALLVSTCTGYLCPGLTSYVSQELGLRSDAFLLDLVGQGCGAAVPNLRTAEALLAGGRAGRVLSVCVEVCSAAFYLDDDPGVLISACLFGDGAGAAVLSGGPGAGRRRVEWLQANSLLNPVQRDSLRFEQRNGMLRNILAPQVPALAAQHAHLVLDAALARAGLLRADISGWVMHPGGRDVLRAVREALELDESDLRWSAKALHDYGNVSSPSVFFVLESALRDSVPDGHWWLSSFGAGFSCHGALLQVG